MSATEKGGGCVSAYGVALVSRIDKW